MSSSESDLDTHWNHRLTARNHATQSENKIHDDGVAAAYGFRGGLVPGADVYAYMAHLPAREWGLDWLAHGGLSARFASPVYDGDEITVDGANSADGVVALSARNGAGDVCATGTAVRHRSDPAIPDPGDWHRGDAASRGAPASAESLAPGTALVPIELGFHVGQAQEYLDEIDETLPLFTEDGVAHPGWLVRLANFVLAAHVRLGPWIHVASDAAFFDVIRDGATLELLAEVTDEFERKGHRFVVLDVLVTADGRPAQRITHTAIHTPRQPGSLADT